MCVKLDFVQSRWSNAEGSGEESVPPHRVSRYAGMDVSYIGIQIY
jgi:hypothetical protein